MATFVLCVILLSAARIAARTKNRNDGQWNGAWSADTAVFHTQSPQSHCPETWFVWNDVTRRCECGASLDGIVSCNEETRDVELLEGYCMSSYRKRKNESHSRSVVGNCCIFKSFSNMLHHPQLYHVVSASALANETTCASMHRDGTLCGKCAEGYSFPVYSYTMDCVRCNYEERQWWLYLAFAYIPLTIFIIVVFLFRINMVHPKFQVCVLVFQMISLPLCARFLLLATEHNAFWRKATQTGLTIYGAWNLDFFKTTTGYSFCFPLSQLGIIALDYATAAYPMLLLIIAYTLVELHGCGFKPVMFMWRPFHRWFAHFRRDWHFQTSIMETFVTFFLLSSAKFFATSCDILVPSPLYNASGDTVYIYWFYDADVVYFGPHHWPYGLLALATLIFIIFPPVCLLLFYQTSCFRKCLEKCKLKGRVLDEFANTLQQYYKDGSEEGTMDCRWFAAVYIIARFIVYAVIISTFSALAFAFFLQVLVILAMLILIIKPYKEEYQHYNIIDIVILMLVALWTASILSLNSALLISGTHYVTIFVILSGIFGITPLVYITMVLLIWVYRQGFCCFEIVSSRIRNGSLPPTDSLPHRFTNSDQYTVNTCVHNTI